MCKECAYQRAGPSENSFMHKIVMWNHIKKAHPALSARVLRLHERLPENLYATKPELLPQ